MNTIIQQLSEELDRMERTIAFQNKVISSMTPSDPSKIVLSSMYGLIGQTEFFNNNPKLKLEDCSWNEIAMYAKSGMAPAVFAVGDVKRIALKDGTDIGVRIIGFNHDFDANDHPVPISFETVETLNNDWQMNSEWTNKGGWEKSQFRAKLNGSFFDEKLPDELKAVITPCAKITGVGEEKEQKSRTIDKLFILSEQEIFGRKIYSIGGEGKWYEWYKRENTPYGKCKQSGKRDYWWERSPYGDNTTSFCGVSNGGNAYNSGASYSYGVSFGFCV